MFSVYYSINFTMLFCKHFHNCLYNDYVIVLLLYYVIMQYHSMGLYFFIKNYNDLLLKFYDYLLCLKRFYIAICSFSYPIRC